jgi:hypothetical protein
MKIVLDNEFVLVRGSVEALLVTTNGMAIKGGCVTWRSHPVTVPGTLAGRFSRWQDRYAVPRRALAKTGVCFLLSGCNFYSLLVRSRYKVNKWPGIFPGR